MDAPAMNGSDGLTHLVLGKRRQHQVADALLGRRIGDRPKQRQTAALAVHGVLARRERDVPAGTASPFPDREPDQLEAVQ